MKALNDSSLMSHLFISIFTSHLLPCKNAKQTQIKMYLSEEAPLGVLYGLMGRYTTLREHGVIQCDITQCPLPTLPSNLSWKSSLPDNTGSFCCWKPPCSPVRLPGSFVWFETDAWVEGRAQHHFLRRDHEKLPGTKNKNIIYHENY